MKIAEAIISINPDAKFTFDNDDINNIQWLENTTPISVADIEAKIAELPTGEQDRQAKADLPDDFPDSVSRPIFEGIRLASIRLGKQL